MTYKFYDTSSLLVIADRLLELSAQHKIIISTITLNELEKIKTSETKSYEIKKAVNKIFRFINEYPLNIEIYLFHQNMLWDIRDKYIEITPDTKILATALDYDKNMHPDETIFVTNDLALKNIANLWFGEDSIESAAPSVKEVYTGFKDVCLADAAMAHFYENLNLNTYELENNEYIIIRDENKDIVDLRCWNGSTHRPISYQPFRSLAFGSVTPIDAYQNLLFDSLKHNDITLVGGCAACGKTYISLSYLFSLLENNKIDRIVVFCNPVVAKHAAKLGFYPGTVEEKLLSSQVGNILSSKLGSQMQVLDLINKEKLILIPAGDARGYEVPANSGVYIMEAQNLDIVLLRMVLQRIGENCKVIVDGDRFEQTDLDIYADENNGMQKMSEVFRGYDKFGQVDLQIIHRSEIAAIAERMK